MSYVYDTFTKFMKKSDSIIDIHFFLYLKCQLRQNN